MLIILKLIFILKLLEYYHNYTCSIERMTTELENKTILAWGDEMEKNESPVVNTEDGFFTVINKKDKYKNKSQLNSKKEKKITKQIEKLQKKQDKIEKSSSSYLEVSPFTFNKTTSSEKTNFSTDYKFTRPCNSLSKGEKCDKGLECTYAHSIGQLKLAKCHFGINCKNIVSGSDCIENANYGKVCTFIHEPIETPKMYCNRVYGFNDDVVVKKSEYIAKSVVKPSIEKLNVSVKPIKEIITKEIIDKETVSTSNVLSSEDKIVIDVPKDMAMQMLEMLVKSGKTNIELRIH